MRADLVDRKARAEAIERARAELAAKSAAAVENTRKSVMAVKQRAIDSFASTNKSRTAKIEVVTASLERTKMTLKAQQEYMQEHLNRETIAREVHLRVNRGLGALEEIITVLKDTPLGEDRILAAISDPAMASTEVERARRASVTELLKSIQLQLIQQSEFINVAAHELRTPITPILVSAEMMESDGGPNSRHIEVIKRNALRLQHLAENILNAARLESGSLKLRTEQFDLNRAISEYLQERIPSGRQVTISFRPSAPELQVIGDRDRLLQAFSNLVDNAVKFSKVGGSVEVLSRHGKRGAIVSIRDEGGGIDQAVLPVLFTKFGAKSQAGTGLGLFICRGVLKAHGGGITGSNYKFEDGRAGAIFEFWVPIHPRGRPEPTRPEPLAKGKA